MIGKTATVVKNDRAFGMVKIDGQTWRAVFPQEEDFNVGDNVIVTNVSGLKVTVTKKDGKNGN
jgi:membrane protein implicated in regulation of membrane protease activity